MHVNDPTALRGLHRPAMLQSRAWVHDRMSDGRLWPLVAAGPAVPRHSALPCALLGRVRTCRSALSWLAGGGMRCCGLRGAFHAGQRLLVVLQVVVRRRVWGRVDGGVR